MAQDVHQPDRVSTPDAIDRPFSERKPGSKSFARRMLRFGTWLLAAGVAIIAAVSACVGGDREFFQDESFVVWLDRGGWGRIAEFMRFEPSPPLYHYVMKLWIDLGGESEVWIRAQSGLCYLASFAVIWWLGKSIFSRSERLGIFVLVIACKSVGFLAIFGRFYEMLFLESCVVVLSFIGLFGAKLPRWLALTLMTLGNFAGLMTHYYFPFFMLAQGIAYLLCYRWRRFGDFLVGAVAPVIAFAVVWGPMFRIQLASGRFNENRNPPPLSSLFMDTYFSGRWAIILPALLLLILVQHRRAGWGPISWGRFRARAGHFLADERARVVVVLSLVTFFTPFLVSMVLGEQFLKSEPTIMLSSLPFVAVLILAVDRSDRWLRVVVGLAIVCVVGLSEGRSRARIVRDRFPAEGTRAAVETILEGGRDGDIVVCLDNYLTKVDYYVRNTRTGVHAEVIGFPKELEWHPGWYELRGLKDMAAFKADARDYAAQVARTIAARPGCRVWVCDNEWVPLSATVALEGFDATMERTRRIAVPKGVGFTEIVCFEPRRARSETASTAGGGISGDRPVGSPLPDR